MGDRLFWPCLIKRESKRETWDAEKDRTERNNVFD